MTTPDKFSVKVGEDAVTVLLYQAPKKSAHGITLILGHGAGGNHLSPFMRDFASGLASCGIDTLTFNFVYSEKRRGAPDRKDKLEACYFAVIQSVLVNRKLKGNQLAIGGKSMGGRIASQVAAAIQTGELSVSRPTPNSEIKKSTATKDVISGLVFLGYPLHPPGKPEQLRDAHLKDVNSPMLFIQGTKDPFATPDELRTVIRKHKLPATLHLIEGGDHSFKVPKSAGNPKQIFESVLDKVQTWLSNGFKD